MITTPTIAEKTFTLTLAQLTNLFNQGHNYGHYHHEIGQAIVRFNETTTKHYDEVEQVIYMLTTTEVQREEDERNAWVDTLEAEHEAREAYAAACQI
jgi:hypothetical protein